MGKTRFQAHFSYPDEKGQEGDSNQRADLAADTLEAAQAEALTRENPQTGKLLAYNASDVVIYQDGVKVSRFNMGPVLMPRGSKGRGSKAALVLVCLMTSAPVIAYPVQGPGATSCAEFAKMYQADPNVETIFYTWAQGFWSSLNLAAKALQNPMRELAARPDDNKRALRSFCADNPLKNYMDGVIQNYGKLPIVP